MDELLRPLQLARRRIEREQRVGEAVVAEALAAVEIRARGARGHEDDAAVRIHGHDRPCVRAAGARGLVRVPRAGRRMVRRIRNRIEGPASARRCTASNARIVPRSRSVARLSPMAEPTMTKLLNTAGGEVTR